jgi:hypothetical protein
LNGWLVIDGGENRPEFDVELSRNVDLPSSRSAHRKRILTRCTIADGNTESAGLADKQLCDSCRTVFRFAGGKLGVAILAGAIGRAPGISDPGGLL